jgi:hypothetical protein
VAQLFAPWTNRIPLFAGVAAPAALTAVVAAVWYWASPKYTDAGYAPRQPVAYSHKRHAGDLGLDCRYCHDTVEVAAHAAVPPTKTCMNCHSVVLHDDPALAPVRESFDSDMPIPWVRVHMLPDYATFDHSVHLAAGVGCAECHGRVDQMRVVRQVQPLSMSWCLDCHRDPSPRLRPRDQVTNMAWDRAASAYDPSRDPSRTRPLRPPVHCSGCHR